MLALADDAGLDRLAARHEQRHVGVAEPERREPLELAREAERERRARARSRRSCVTGTRSSSASASVGVRGERVRERLELLRVDREARRRRGGRRSAAGARSTRRARRGGRTTEIERPEPFQSPSPVPAISTTGRLKRSTRRDATMPITPSCQSSPQMHVAAAAALRLGPRLDLGDGRAQDAVLDRLAVAVQLLELGGEPRRLLLARRSAAARAPRRDGRAGRRR